MNTTTLVGTLTTDPVIDTTTSGVLRASLRLAVPRPIARDGRSRGRAVFEVWAFGALAQRCAAELARDARLALSGRLEQHTRRSLDGELHDRVYVIANRFHALVTADQISSDRAPVAA